MNNMPKKLREACAADPFYRLCARQEALHDHECKPNPLNGRLIEWEHALINAGKQLQKKWAIIPICWWAHSGPGLVKAINEWIALGRATDAEILEVSRARDYFLHRGMLNKTYGIYKPPAVDAGITYPWAQDVPAINY